MTTSIQTDALLSQLATLAYKDRDFLNNPANLPAGWTFVRLEAEGAFAAAIFRDTSGQIAIAFRGTNGLSDVLADGSILAGGWNSQFQQGMDLVKKVLTEEKILSSDFDKSQLLVTGHSLGGAIAQIVAQAYGLDGSTIDPGAAKRIVESDGFKAATLAAGLPEGGLGVPTTFTNHLVVGSVVSGGTGEHLGEVSYIPSLNFSSMDALNSFLLAVVNPVAGFVYAVGVDQFGNKHSSQQISEALGLLAGLSTDAEGAGRITLSPKVVGIDADTGAPRYSQTEFEIKDADGEIKGTVKFSGQGLDRTLEMFDADGQLKSTVRQSSNGGVVTITGNDQNIEIKINREQQVENDNGTVTIIRRNSAGQIISTTTTQTFDDGSQLELKTEGGKTFVRSLVPNEDGGIDRSEWAELKASQPELTPAAYQQLIYSDMAGFLSALRTGDKLNQALYGVKLTLDVMLSQGKTVDQSMAGLRNGLDAVAGAVGVVASLHALQSDDTLTQLNGAVGLLSSSNQLFAAMNGGAIGEQQLIDHGFMSGGALAAMYQTRAHCATRRRTNNHRACRASHSKQTQGAQHA